jgi:hypothetical protein
MHHAGEAACPARVRRQRLAPAFDEAPLVADLAALGRVGSVPAVRLLVHDHCDRGWYSDAQPPRAHREGEVGVFVIRRRIRAEKPPSSANNARGMRNRRTAHVSQSRR